MQLLDFLCCEQESFLIGIALGCRKSLLVGTNGSFRVFHFLREGSPWYGRGPSEFPVLVPEVPTFCECVSSGHGTLSRSWGLWGSLKA